MLEQVVQGEGRQGGEDGNNGKIEDDNEDIEDMEDKEDREDLKEEKREGWEDMVKEDDREDMVKEEDGEEMEEDWWETCYTLDREDPNTLYVSHWHGGLAVRRRLTRCIQRKFI